MKSQAHVLLVGKDEMLLRTRQLILGTFFRVETAGRVSHATGILAEHHFDLIVLCYSLSDDERQQVLVVIQRQPHMPQILNLTTADRPCAPAGNYQELDSDGGPYALVRKCAEMLGVELKTIGRTPQPALRATPAFRF